MDIELKKLIGALVFSLLFIVALIFIKKRENRKTVAIYGKYKSKFLGDHNLLVTILMWFSLIMFLIFLSISFARPRFGERDVEIKKIGIDLLVAMDISRSMLAEDVKPSRFEYSKMVVSKIISRFRDGRIGLVVFSGDGYVLSPLTEDYSAIYEFLGELDESMTTNGGTDFYNLAQKTSDMFIGNLKSKLLVIVSDGEDHSRKLDDAISLLKEKGVKVVTIGVGTSTGAPILVYDKNGNRNYLKDGKGNIVYTKLDNSSLVKIATSTGGKYFNLNGNLLNTDKILKYVSSLKKSEIKSKKITKKAEQYQIFLLIAIINLLIFLILYNWPRKKEIE